MFGQNPVKDARRAVRAILGNQVAHWAPRLHARLTGETGRGTEQGSPQDVAEYFRSCFEDYFRALDVAPKAVPAFLDGKRLLEYGPGDVPAVALLMVAHGAESVVCVDRFPLLDLSETNGAVVRSLLQGLDGERRRRAESCFVSSGDPESGLSSRIRYLIRPSGLSGLRDAVDLVLSRSVLEHVDDLPATFADMYAALREGGLAVHKVDLKSHGLHKDNSLDFLTWPQGLWSLMYSNRGVPNRWRIDTHRRAMAASGLHALSLRPTLVADPREMQDVRPHLSRPFRSISDEDLSWLGYWAVLQKGARTAGT
jgi:SAM-dependent methyltransferase